MRYIEKICLKSIEYYFLLMAINGCLIMLGYGEYAKFDLLIMMSGFVVSFCAIYSGLYKIEIFLLLFGLSIAYLSLLNNYDGILWYDGCKSQLIPMLFFIVGRYSNSIVHYCIERGIKYFIIVCIIGLLLYVGNPDWYITYKMSIWEGVDDSINKILEMSRFSSFWRYPYWISYGGAIIYAYTFFKSGQNGTILRKDYFLLGFIFCITILTQQRAPLLFIIMITIIYLLSIRNSGRIFKKNLLFYLLLMILFVIVVFSSMDEDMLLRLFDKVDIVANTNFLKERSDIFSSFYKKDISFLGDGIGRYSHLAYYKNSLSITDHQYMKILYETGFWGCFGYILIICYAIFKGINNLSQCKFELYIIFFYMIAMTGANCLCSFDQHPIMFWMCCGSIVKKSKEKNI